MCWQAKCRADKGHCVVALLLIQIYSHKGLHTRGDKSKRLDLTTSFQGVVPRGGGVLRYISDGDVRSTFFGFEICDLRTFFGFEIL